MPATNRCLIIIAATDQATENQWIVDNIDPNGSGTFTAALTADGSTISNYWTGGLWYDDQFGALQDHFGANLYAGITPDDLLKELNLQRYSNS